MSAATFAGPRTHLRRTASQHALFKASKARVATWTRESHDLDEGENPQWLADVAADFNRLSRPGRGTDGMRPTSPVALARALVLLSNVMSPNSAPPVLVPRFEGGLQMEWHQNDVDLEIYVDADGSLGIWCEHLSGREWEEEGDAIDLVRLRKELSLLVRDGV